MALVSLIIIALTLVVCDLLRQEISTRLAPKSLLKSLTLDFLVSMELCSVAFELGVIFEHYGQLFWTIGLFLNSTYQVLRWKECSMPSPQVHLIDHLAGSKSVFEAGLRSLVLMMSGLASYRYLKWLWQYEVSALHVGRPQALDACVYPWIDVPMYQAGLSEFFGSFILGILPRLAQDNPFLTNCEPVYTALVIASMVTVAVSLALNFSGGMFNPMLASVLIGGCHGHPLWEHVLVYYVASTLGAFLAFRFYPSIQEKVYANSQDNQGKKKV